MVTGTDGLSAEQQELLASIMQKSAQAGGGGGFKVSQVPIPASVSRAAQQAGLDSEQEALLAEIMGKSLQAGGGNFTSTPAAAGMASSGSAPAAPSGGSNQMLSQAEIDALIASMGK